MFKNIKISVRLWFLLGSIIAFLVIFVFVGYLRLKDLEMNFKEVAAESEEMQLIANLSLAISRSAMPPNDYFIIGGDVNERWTFINLTTETEKLFEELESHAIGKIEEKEILDRAKNYYSEFNGLASDIFKFSPEELYKDFEFGVKMEKMDELNGRALASLAEWHKFAQEEVLEVSREYESTQELLLYIIIFVIIFIVLWSFVFGIIIIRSIVNPIDNLVKVTKDISGGSLNRRIETDSRDEVGKLTFSFNKMIEAIKQSRIDVDKKIEEQTAFLRDQGENLENQQKAILNILEDVEEEKIKSSQERDKIDAILHSIGDGVFVIDENYKIVIYNKVCETLSGFSAEEAIGKRYDAIFKFINEDTKKINDEFINKVFSTGKTQEMSNHSIIVRKDKSEISVSDSAAPLKDKNDKIIGCVVVFRDVTQERAIDKTKSEFVSLASHQLRTPLSAIGWYTEMLLAGDAGKITGGQKDYLEEIYKGNQRMVGLVNALLNVSRLELGTFIVEPSLLDITKIADEVLKELDVDIKKKKIKLTKKYDKTLAKINVDKKLTYIIFQNLFSNSVKYTLEKGKVNVEIFKKGKDLEVIVADNGMGIPKNQQDQIFTKLFRADNVREADSNGTGLGLYIVKSILDEAGGKIWFESAEKKGTTFHMVVPLSGMKKKEGLKQLS